MKQSHRLNRIQATAFIIGFTLSLLLAASHPAAAAPELVINKVYVTNVRESTFTVTWTTDLPSNATVRYGTSLPFANSTPDTVSDITTHQVVITGLTASTTYYFEVESGGVTDNNGGSYYMVTTGPILPLMPPAGVNIGGFVYQSYSTTTVPYALVYLRVLDDDGTGSPGASQWVCVRADSAGFWEYTLGYIRTSDYSDYFSYTASSDLMQLVGQGGAAGVYGEAGSEAYEIVPATETQIDIYLTSEPTAVTAQSFAADGVQDRMWVAPLLALLLLSALAVLGRELNPSKSA